VTAWQVRLRCARDKAKRKVSSSEYFENEVLQAYRDFDRRPTRTNAVQLAVAAWHLQDRLREEHGNPESFTQKLFSFCPELDLVRRLANVGKHRRLRDPSQMVTLEGSEGGGLVESFGPLGTTSAVDCGSLELVEANKSRHDLRRVFSRVIEFWRSEVK
jgi:hypothetical protein